MAKIIDPDKLVTREVYDSVKREYKISLIEDNKNLELKKWLKEHKPYQIDSVHYFNSIFKVGGSLSKNEMNAWDRFVISSKVSGIWDKIEVFYPSLGNTKESKLINAKFNT